MRENENLPDIEKLDPLEFNLDVEGLQQLQAEGEEEVAKVMDLRIPQRPELLALLKMTDFATPMTVALRIYLPKMSEAEWMRLLNHFFIIKVQNEIELENLTNCYLREVLKRECWDSMKVKERAIKVM